MTLAKLLVAIGASTGGFHRGLAGVQRSVDKLDGRLGKLRGGFSRAGGALARMGRQAAKLAAVTLVALALALGSVVSASIAYEDAFAGVRKTVDATEPELAALSKEIRQMATEIPIAATELAGLGETAGALGVPTKSIREFIRVTALLGVTTDLSAQQAADSLGVLGNVLKLRESDYSRFGSALVALGNAGASTESQIIQIAQRMGAAGKLAGLSTPQIIGFASAIASLGIEPEAGGSSLQTFLIQVTKIASAGGDKLRLLAKTSGLTGKQFRKAFEKDAGGALLTFFKGMNKLGKAERLAVISALGFNDIRITRALLGLADNSQLLEEQLNLSADAWERNSAMTAEAEKRFATTKSQLALLKNNLLEIAMTLGDAILPLVTPLVKGLNEWITANHELIGQIAGQLVTGLQTVIGWIATWVAQNQPLIRQVWEFATGALKTLWSVLTTQVIPALFGKGGKGGIIPAVVELGRQIFEWLVPKVQAFITTLTQPGGVIESVTEVAGPVLTGLMASFGKVVDALFGTKGQRGLIPALGDLIGVLWGDGKGPLAVAVKAIGGGISFFVDNTVAPAIRTIATLVDWLSTAVRGVFVLIDALNALTGNTTPKGMRTLPRSGIPGMADGGWISPNRPTLVGEDGPEVVASRTAAEVIPNGEWQGLGQGGDINVTVEGLLRAETPDDVGRTLRRYAALGLIGAPRRAGAMA
ncbi:MAG: phage tail tape measure protein [Chloroflexota bacterium]